VLEEEEGFVLPLNQKQTAIEARQFASAEHRLVRAYLIGRSNLFLGN
jgi:hypothetical protein